MAREFDDTLGGKLEQLAQTAADHFADKVRDEGVAQLCESEIEGMLSVAFLVCSHLDLHSPGFICNEMAIYGWEAIDPFRIDEVERLSKRENVIYIYPQVIVGGSRVDFMCYMRLSRARDTLVAHRFLAIECDGHDFHERTKAQAARDRSKDRTLLLNGIPCMRFTGSEIWADAYDCVTQIDSFFCRSIREFHDLPIAQEGPNGDV